MKKIFLLGIMVLLHLNNVYGQNISSNINIKKLNAQANVLAKSFCDCIVDVGTSSRKSGISIAHKKELIKEVSYDFYNYREDPRIMTTTMRNGKKAKKPIYTYMNNLLTQSESPNSRQMRKYEIRCENFYLTGGGDDWKFVRRLSDGCELYCREFTFYQTYRIVDMLNRNPEFRNTEYKEQDKKTMQIFAIKQPGNGKIIVRLGDIIRSECTDSRK